MPREPARRLVIAVWAVALLLLAGRPLLQPHRNTVYPIFAEAGRRWLEARDLYEPHPDRDAFRYSPLVAAGFVPFGLLPDGAGGLLWRLVGAAVFLGSVAWWVRAVLPPTLTPRQRALLYLLPVPLALGNLYNGQTNLLIIGLLLLAVAAVARDRLTLAALCVAVASVFKVYPIVVGLLLVCLYPRRLGRRLVLPLAAGALLPFLLQRPGYVAEQHARWVAHLGDNDRQQLGPQWAYRDARLLWSVWVAPMSYGAYQVVQAAAGGAIAVACLWARRSGLARPHLLTLALGLGCCWMTALGPASESATYVLLAPTAAWLLVSGTTGRHPIALRALWLIGYALLVASQATALLPAEWGRALKSLGPQPAAALLLLGGQLYLAFGRNSVTGPAARGSKQTVPTRFSPSRL
jgi:hypothetical protein